MESYGQFCPLALASEVVGERWTPLVLRELMLGARRFNDIHRGVPRMSPSLLSKRLKQLQSAGIVARRGTGRKVSYVLTDAGEALRPVVEGLAAWGKHWLPATLTRERADPDVVMWDMSRRMATDRMPADRTVIQFDFTDQPERKRHRWLVGDRHGIEMCITEPGFDVDLFVTTDSRTVVSIWYGDLPLRRAIRQGQVDLHGPSRLCRAFPSWLQLSVIAEVPRRQPIRHG
jgi:DNA-binding HxlR family transcriptional regulator